MASQADQTAALTAAYLARQQLLAVTLVRDVVVLVRELFQPARPGPSWTATKVALDTLIRERRRQSADVAARYYLDMRRASLHPSTVPPISPGATAEVPTVERRPAREVVESITRGNAAAPAGEDQTALDDALGLDTLSEEDAWAELERIAGAEPSDLLDDRVAGNLDATGIGSYQRALRAGQPPEKAIDTMAVNLTGSATSLALEGGREAIRDAVDNDEDAIGWLRVTDADPCSWCVMLASRGAVYKNASTVGQGKSDAFVGHGLFKWHDHCGCNAIPVFSADDPRLRAADDLYEQWLRETQGHSGKNAVNAWRRYWENRDQPDEN